MSLKEILKLVLGWRFLILLIAIPAMFLLVQRPGFTELNDKPSLENIFTMWSNFDGVNYLDLAEFGYGAQNMTNFNYSFFPVYPWLIRTVNIFGNYLASGLVISHTFLIFSLYLLYKLILLDHKKKIAKSAIYLLLIFPTAFFFGSVYAESLFLFLVLLTFYLARKNQFFLACLVAAVASATKVTGIFLWPVLIYEYWIFNKEDIKSALNPMMLWLTLPPLGLLAFLKFQYLKTGDALIFINFQENFAGRSLEKLVLLHQIFFRYGKMLIFTDHWDPLFFTILLELFCATLVLLVLIFSYKILRRSYWLFTLLSFLLPTLSGTFSGIPRYTLIMFPVFIFIALWLEKHHPYYKYAYFAISIILSILAVIFFTRGYFVA